MKYLIALLISIVYYGSTTVFAADLYGQNIYMFPDELINTFQSGCSDNSPVKQSKFHFPMQKQPHFKPQKQQYNAPSINRLSRNVAYVSDLYKSNSYEVPSPGSIIYPGATQSYINEDQLSRQLVTNSIYRRDITPQNTRKNTHSLNRALQGVRYNQSSKLLYASDFEDKTYSGQFYRQDDRYAQREQIRYVPVPVYVYKMPESEYMFDSFAQNRFLSKYQQKNSYDMRHELLKRKNISFDPYADMDTTDISYYDPYKSGMNFMEDNQWSTNSLTEFDMFSSLENTSMKKQHSLDNLLGKYSTLSVNDDFYNPTGLLKYNLSGDILSPGSTYLLNP